MRIPKGRWEEAQKVELSDWENTRDIVGNEWQEAFNKYNVYFKRLEKKLKVLDSWAILDVGCNLTCVSRMIKAGKHYGIDPLADILEIQSKIKEFEIVNGIGEDLPYEKNLFDLVVCRNVIDHTHDPQKVISEVHRVLKDSQFLVLACYVYNPFISLVKNIGEKIKLFRNPAHPHTFTTMSLENLIAKGFNVIENEIIYEGKDPNDFGKVSTAKTKLPMVQRLILTINNILGYKWFVREYLLLCQKK